ncbi:MAG: NAD(P)-binding protein, partial [Clostridia bacterium]
MEPIEKIQEKAKYCLNCKHKPCQKACPMQTSIPSFIEKIKEDNIEEAYKILMDNNIFSPICSAICPQEDQCEGSCTRGIRSNPVDIGKLEHWVNEYAKNNSIEYHVKQKENNKHLVAVIGSGPASLSCAFELAKEGTNVTIFEKENELGGILRYGIPPYRLNKKDLE